MLEPGQMIRSGARARRPGSMELSTRETSKVASSMEEASSSGMTSLATMGSSSRIKFRAAARTTGPTTAATSDSG